HIASNNVLIDFGCLKSSAVRDSVNAFTLKNTGSYPLVINDLAMSQGAGTFNVIAPKLPDTIEIGDARSYAVRYKSGSGSANGTLQVKSSAPETISIALKGDVCSDV